MFKILKRVKAKEEILRTIMLDYRLMSMYSHSEDSFEDWKQLIKREHNDYRSL